MFDLTVKLIRKLCSKGRCISEETEVKTGSSVRERSESGKDFDRESDT